jgi:hypothetical protein
MKTIDFNNFGKSVKQTQKEETELYRRYLSNSGMEEITKDEFLAMLEELNYKIDKSMCTSYYNNYNALNYLAYGLSYTDKKTKLSYAHYTQRDSNHENLDKLQKIRSNYFVFENGRIWDL